MEVTESSILSKITGQKIAEVKFTELEIVKDFLNKDSSDGEFESELKNILAQNVEKLAELMTHETGKPLAQSIEELRTAIDTLETSDDKTKSNRIIVIGSFATPIRDLVNAVTTHNFSKLVYKSSTKVSSTMSFLGNKISENPSLNSKILVVIMDKAQLAELLSIENFDKVVKYTRGKMKGIVNLDDRSSNDRLMIIDESVDINHSTGLIAEYIFNYQKSTSYRLQNIFVASEIYDQFAQKLIEKIDLVIEQGRADNINVNFVDNLKNYQREKLKSILLEIISFGADVLYGTIQDQIKGPILLGCDTDMMEYYRKILWGPLLFLVKYDNFMTLPNIIKDLNEKEGIAFLKEANFDFLKKRSKLLLINYSK